MSNETKEYWESFSNQTNFISFKDAKEGDNWSGWYHGVKKGKMGHLVMLKDATDEIITLPYSGSLKSQFENHMKVQKWDFVKIEYLGMKKIESGDWEGQDCHQFKTHRNPAWSSEDYFKFKVKGIPLPEKEPETGNTDVEVANADRALDNIF